MNHYCTYFDAGFLIQGVALWQSLRAHDPDAVLWVLALDPEAERVLRAAHDDRLQVVALAELEADDGDLAAVKARRSRVEYYFTLSPCWPRHLLRRQPALPAVTYVDADLLFFHSTAEFFTEVASSGASVAITPHRFPPALRAYEQWGRFNVGVLFFRNDPAGRAVLDDWRRRCLDWCADRLEGDRFADQKYLDAWPERFGRTVHVVVHEGMNLAPWNWSQYACRLTPDDFRVNGRPLIAFHFARFRRVTERIWDSGQLEYAVMPADLRNWLYGRYWQALEAARRGPLLAGRHGYPGARLRAERAGSRGWLLRFLFGSLWYRLGGRWWALGVSGLGRHSGSWLNRYRQGKQP